MFTLTTTSLSYHSINSIEHPSLVYFVATKTTMEVEVKLRLPDASTHQKLSDLLSPFHLQTLIQENIFFDGSNSELSSNRAVLRLRFYDVASRCVLSLKAKPVISDGVSRVSELEEPFDPVLGRACVAEPWRLLGVSSSTLLKRVREEFGVGEQGFVCLGGFRNVRSVYEWKGLKLELDESNFDFGTCYELECESLNPEKDKKVLEGFLEENGIRYKYSDVSKFGVFKSGKLPE
ncbi:putative hydrolase [Rosa chinensis]|uniref:Putative hydrolase n=1 Tax=Rosa chinensis TaxID=74649 RepID=A0A2P6RVU2_ROSCH|nr:triphosphate tunnel metalloenzyme 3 [Rosa chinensis]PRQ50547.1 putative hydrolase [Rosa chinensis]